LSDEGFRLRARLLAPLRPRYGAPRRQLDVGRGRSGTELAAVLLGARRSGCDLPELLAGPLDPDPRRAPPSHRRAARRPSSRGRPRWIGLAGVCALEA